MMREIAKELQQLIDERDAAQYAASQYQKKAELYDKLYRIWANPKPGETVDGLAKRMWAELHDFMKKGLQ